jgi:hypothetical protein
MVRKIRFSTIRPMTITVNRPANTAGISRRFEAGMGVERDRP